MNLQVYLDGDLVAQSQIGHIAMGDSIEFTFPGFEIIGSARVVTFKQKLQESKDRLAAKDVEIEEIKRVIRNMTIAESLDEAIGIAYREGMLTDAR